LQAVLINLQALISALMTDKNATLLKPIAVYEFIAVTHFMTDVLTITGRLCRIFQKKNLDFAYARTSLEAHTSALQTLCKTLGIICKHSMMPYLRVLRAKIKQPLNGKVMQ
jgi:hypothetical protein